MKIAFVLLFGWLSGIASAREWMSTDDRFIEADYVRTEGDLVVLKIGRREVKMKISLLCTADRNFIREQNGGEGPEPEIEPVKKQAGGMGRTMDFEGQVPSKVGPPAEVTVETVKEDAETSEYVYTSNRFEFHCNRRLTSRVVAGFAKLYEATYDAVQAMPWNAKLDPRNSSGRFLVKLFTEEEDFIKAGGIPGSAGTASGAVSLVQLKFLGVKDTGSRLILEDVTDSGVIRHELTHSLRDEADRGLPTWAIEGFAEYITSAPYERTGRFDFRNRLENAARYSSGKSGANGSVKMPLRLEKLLGASRAEFYKDENGGLGKGAGVNYAMSTVVMTYFWHADTGKNPDGPVGGPIRAWLQAIKNGQPETAARALLLDGRTYEDIEKSMVSAYRGTLKIEF